MKQTLKNIKHTFKNIFKRKIKYNLHFIKEDDGNWYIDLPEWPFNHHNLMMVAGADELCAFLNNDDTNTYVEVIPSDKHMVIPDYACLIRQNNPSIVGGATYSVTNLIGFEKDIWICPVTLFVLGYYPKYIYIKKQEK